MNIDIQDLKYRDLQEGIMTFMVNFIKNNSDIVEL